MAEQFETFDLAPWLEPQGGPPVDPSVFETLPPEVIQSQPVVMQAGPLPVPGFNFSTINLRRPAGTPMAFLADYGMYIAAGGGALLLLALLMKRR
jgi:hypothetical protein